MNTLRSLPVAEIERVARAHGARSVRVFGYRAREATSALKATATSTFLLASSPGRSLLDLIAIKQNLEDMLHLSVDVVTEAGSPHTGANE